MGQWWGWEEGLPGKALLETCGLFPPAFLERSEHRSVTVLSQVLMVPVHMST
jgi:hypothetical protein